MFKKSILTAIVVIGAVIVIERHAIISLIRTVVDLVISCSWGEMHQSRALVSDSLIAHACGGLGGRAYTNSLNALDSNYARGHRVFELDLERTTDGELVLIHDWEGSWEGLHPIAPTRGRRSLAEFLGTPMVGGLVPMDWLRLADWMTKHPDAKIVTDVKADNLAILEIMAGRKDLVPRIVPQIYNFRQFEPVQKMGYPRILLTLYRLDVRNWAVLQFIKSHPISGVVCWPHRGREGGLAKKIGALGVPVIAHTINGKNEVDELRSDGFTGVMTDFLTP